MAQTRTEKIVIDSLKARGKKERNFRLFGVSAIALAVIFLAILLVSIVSKGAPGFFQYYAIFEVELTRENDSTLGVTCQTSPCLKDKQKRSLMKQF